MSFRCNLTYELFLYMMLSGNKNDFLYMAPKEAIGDVGVYRQKSFTEALPTPSPGGRPRGLGSISWLRLVPEIVTSTTQHPTSADLPYVCVCCALHFPRSPAVSEQTNLTLGKRYHLTTVKNTLLTLLSNPLYNIAVFFLPMLTVLPFRI
jgi:hypothetical protein